MNFKFLNSISVLFFTVCASNQAFAIGGNGTSNTSLNSNNSGIVAIHGDAAKTLFDTLKKGDGEMRIGKNYYCLGGEYYTCYFEILNARKGKVWKYY